MSSSSPSNSAPNGLSPYDHLELFQTEAMRLGQAPAGQLDLDIPHLDGWTVRSVLGHTGWVFRFARLCLQATPEESPSRSSVPEPPPGDEVLDWYATGRDELLDRLASLDLDALHHTFTGPQPARWWVRRLGHEVSMHRWDAQTATARPDPIDPRQARDGVDEVLEVFTPHRMQFATLAGTGETLHLHATDIDDGEWMLTLNAEEVAWERTHAKGDVAAKGSMSDLLLFLWGRIPPSRLEIFGEASLLDRWQAAAVF